MRCCHIAAMLGLLMTIAGCASHVPYALSKDDAARFGAGTVRMRVAGTSVPIVLGLAKCEVYRATIDGTDIVGWERTAQATGSYLDFMTVCTRQRLTYDGRFAHADLCRTAIGAGGGCANSASLKSRDGVHWISE